MALQLYSSPQSNYKSHIFKIRCQLFLFLPLLFHHVSPFHMRRLGLKSSTLKLMFHTRAFKSLCVRGPFPWQQDEIRLWLCRALDWEKHLKISLCTVKMGRAGEQKKTKRKNKAELVKFTGKFQDMTGACISIFCLLVFFFFRLDDLNNKNKDLLLLRMQYFPLWEKKIQQISICFWLFTSILLKHNRAAWQMFMNSEYIINAHSCSVIVSYAFC